MSTGKIVFCAFTQGEGQNVTNKGENEREADINTDKMNNQTVCYKYEAIPH